MEIINNDSIKNILYENRNYIEIKSGKKDDNSEYSKKIEELRKISPKKIVGEENRMNNKDEEYKAQIKEIESELKQENNNINIQNNYINDEIMKKLQTMMDGYQEKIINNLNSNFINLINDKFEEIKKFINKQINFNINKNNADMLNHIKNSVTEIINKYTKTQDQIKKDIGKTQNELNIEKIEGNYNINKNNSTFNIYNQKEINNNKQHNNYFKFSGNIISNKNIIQRIKYNNNLLNENKNNEKKKEITYTPRNNIISDNKYEQSLNTTRNKRNNFGNQDDNLINSSINVNKGTSLYDLNKKNNSLINSNKKEINSYKKEYYNTEANDRNDKPKIILKKDDKPIISQKKDDNQKIYQSINNIFFYDYQQKYIKGQKINEYKKEELEREIINDKAKGRNILKNYYMNYIETIILPLFNKNKNINKSKLEIIKYNISVILECLGMDKNYYNNYYNQYEIKKHNFNRCYSQEALIKFRKEFKISKEDFTDEAIEKRLIENDLDINKTFGKMFG